MRGFVKSALFSETLLVLKREFRRIFSDSRLMLIMFAAPVVYAILMGLVYSNHQANDLPIALLQQDHSAYARSYVRMIEISPKIEIAYRVQSEEEIKTLMNQGKIDGAVVIPRDFSLRVKRGEDAFVGGFVNASSLIPANTISSALNLINQTFSTGVEVAKLKKGGITSEEALVAAIPVKLSLRPMYNPAYNYSNFMVPGLFITILQQIILMGVALSFSGERELGTVREILALSRRKTAIIVGKGLPYFVLSFLMTEFYLRVLFPLNEIPIVGNFAATITFTLLFIAVIVTWGLWVSILTANRLLTTQILMFIALPSFVLSGFTWPLSAMPPFVQGLSNLLPMTHFVSSFRALYLAGASLWEVMPSVITLLLFLVINILLAMFGVSRLYKAGPLIKF